MMSDILAAGMAIWPQLVFIVVLITGAFIAEHLWGR